MGVQASCAASSVAIVLKKEHDSGAGADGEGRPTIAAALAPEAGKVLRKADEIGQARKPR